MMKKVFYATLATLFLATGTVCAGDTFEALDVDKDGAISQEEAQAMQGLTEQFKNLDLNEDGKLDMDEFALFVAAK